MAKKTRRIVMTADRYAHPTMGDLAKGAAEFVAPRTVGDGLTIANIFGDAAEMTPFAGAVPFVEDRLDLRNYDEDTIAIMAILGLLPFAGKITRKVNKMVPNPNGGFILNPAYSKPMTKAQKEATNQAIKEWNSGVAINKRQHSVRPETIPAPVTYEQKTLNITPMSP